MLTRAQGGVTLGLEQGEQSRRISVILATYRLAMAAILAQGQNSGYPITNIIGKCLTGARGEEEPVTLDL